MIAQPHSFDVWRPTEVQRTAQEISGYTLTYEGVSGFVQNMDSKEAFYYMQRGLEDMYTVYTVRTDLTFQRNDIVDFDGKQLHVVGIQNGCQLDVYLQLDCYAYPEAAKKRLSKESYE